jgi:hypothetical protein
MKLAGVLVLLIAVTGLASYSLVAAQEKRPSVVFDKMSYRVEARYDAGRSCSLEHRL